LATKRISTVRYEDACIWFGEIDPDSRVKCRVARKIRYLGLSTVSISCATGVWGDSCRVSIPRNRYVLVVWISVVRLYWVWESICNWASIRTIEAFSICSNPRVQSPESSDQPPIKIHSVSTLMKPTPRQPARNQGQLQMQHCSPEL